MTTAKLFPASASELAQWARDHNDGSEIGALNDLECSIALELTARLDAAVRKQKEATPEIGKLAEGYRLNMAELSKLERSNSLKHAPVIRRLKERNAEVRTKLAKLQAEEDLRRAVKIGEQIGATIEHNAGENRRQQLAELLRNHPKEVARALKEAKR